MDFLRDPIGFIINWFVSWLQGTGLSTGWVEFISSLLGAGILALSAMLFVIFLIWYERKLIGRIQDRFGPNRVGPWGIFQPIADMLKIFTKEYITPKGADLAAYNIAPVLAVGAVLMVWSVIPFTMTVVGADLNVGFLYILAVGALGEMGFILAGWGSNNKYALLGAFRSVAQLISYEVPLVISALVPVMFSGTLSATGLVQSQTTWNIFLAPAAAIIFFIATIAETGRSPFDLIEAESELVAGYNIEYSGLKFGMFYVGEFLHAFTAALIFATVFLGGWRGPGAEQIPILGFVYLMLKTFVVHFTTILIRGTMPRFRIDQMMDLNWKILTPAALATVMVIAITDRIVMDAPGLVRGIALFAVNVLILWVVERLLGKSQRRVVPEVSDHNRPVARYNAAEPGAQS
jgi:NADH-quinone oxidoreductase subunit H